MLLTLQDLSRMKELVERIEQHKHLDILPADIQERFYRDMGLLLKYHKQLLVAYEAEVPPF